MTYRWQRNDGYEVSSQGDRRFSALFAQMPDRRSIEMHYQCDVKGYDPGGYRWKLGKGKPPLKPVDTWAAYLGLWRTWASLNPELIAELRDLATDGIISDRFASTPINQARALSIILNEGEAR